MLGLLAAVTDKLCPAFCLLSFYFVHSAARRDKGCESFPQVYRFATASIDYVTVTPFTRSGMISVLLQVALMTSFHMKHQAQRHIQGGGAPPGRQRRILLIRGGSSGWLMPQCTYMVRGRYVRHTPSWRIS